MKLISMSRVSIIVAIVFSAISLPVYGRKQSSRVRKSISDAEIRYRSDSDCAPGGKVAVLVNRLTNKSIKVTVRITMTTSGQSGTRDDVATLPAGGERPMGCTVEGAVPPYIYNSFKIVGVED